MKSTFIKSLSEISSNNFSEIIDEKDKPFMSYEYLYALEKSKSAHFNNGCGTFHLTLNEKNKLLGFIPIYKKNNSHGEFVFDHQWSYVLRRAGRDYYPKLLSAIPFTPCETRKFISPESIDVQDFIDPVVNHMQKHNIQEGDLVKKGTVIGFVGSTGRVTGPHLHWTVYLNENRINPELFIELDYLQD